jgi:hypothetical protein
LRSGASPYERFEDVWGVVDIFIILSSKDSSESFSSNSSGELDVFGHDGDSSGVDGTEIGIFEETDEVSFGGFLESEDGGTLESEFVFEFSGDFSNESLEGEFSDQEIGALLIFSDFSEGDGSGSESVGFLDTSGSGGRFSGGLVGELFSGSLETSGFSCGLLSSCHL